MLPEAVDVVIVGAGPTGLALAIALRQAGVSHLLVDRLEAGHNTSRAAVIHAHTLEVLDRIGVVGELVARGLRLPRFRVRDRDNALLSLRFDQLPSAHPYLLMIPQDETERVLAARLESLGGTAVRSIEATGLVERADGIAVRLKGPDGEHVVNARFVVGADGMRSTVRESAGIAFDGSSFEQSFVLADVAMDWPLGRGEVSLFFAPEGLVVVAPLPDGSFRIVATLDDAPEHPGVGDVQRLLDTRGPAGRPGRIGSVVWSTRFRLHHRVASAYRRGKVFLMGDAAHVHSPAGGQGMNTGLVDAVVLGDLLARVLRDGAPESALDAYEALRRPAAVEVMKLSGRLTGMATTRSAVWRAIRNAVLRLVNVLPPVRRRLQLGLSGLARAAYARPGR